MANTYVKIAEYTLPTNAVAGSFTNIPQVYTDLSIYVTARGTNASGTNEISYYFNNTATSTYKRANFYFDYSASYGNGTTTGYTTTINNGLGNIPSGSATAGAFGGHSLLISEYSSSTKIKTVLWSGETGTFSTTANAGYSFFGVGAWNSTDPITSITFSGNSNYASGSTVTLYGISKS